MSVFRRSLSLLLALVMVFSCVPVSVFAEQVTGCPHHTTHTDSCGYREAVAGVACGHVCGEDCPIQDVTVCVHDHAASGCTYTEPQEARYCGHTCGDGSCAYAPAVAGVDCTCTPVLTHGETCASLAEGECDCVPTMTHEATCAPVEAKAEVQCDFAHDGCGCADAVTGGWNCAHTCTVDSGCVKTECVHACPGDDCGYVAAVSAAPCAYSCGICAVQQLIDALPVQVTAENLETVTAQLTAIDQARLKLTDEQLELVDFARYQEAVSAISTLSGQPDADEPEMADIVTGMCGDNLTWEFNTTTGVLTVTGTGAMWDYGNTDIGYYGPWFSIQTNQTRITSVVIQSGVTTIGDCAFYSCDDVVSATIPSTVTSIGENAFRETKLNSITVPGSVKTIGDFAFQGCPLTGGVTLNSGLQTLGDGVFCETKVTSVTLPDTVTGFGKWFFSDCTSLTSVKLPSGLTNIPDCTFDNCAALKTVTIPQGVTWIGFQAFKGSGITSIQLPASVEYIYEAVFTSCDGLKEITIPKGVNYIGNMAFQNSGLTKITFLGCPSVIGNTAFHTVKADAYYYDNGQWTYLNPLLGGGQLNWIAMDPCADGHAYIYTNLYNGKHTKACDDCDLTSVTENHTYVSGVCACGQAISGNCGDNATWSYNTATGVLTISGTGAMYDYMYSESNSEWVSGKTPGWYGLEISKVNIGSGITVVGGYAFFNMDLDAVTLASTVKTIGAAAFMNCSSLSEITIPASVGSIGMEAFTGCGTISVTFSGIAPTIGDDAFLNTTATCYYPADNASWTESVRGQYGGSVTWVPYGGHTHSFNNDNLCSCGLIGGYCGVTTVNGGRDLIWVFDESTGTLTISGTGAMSNGSKPWYDWRSKIKTVIVEEGCTSIGSHAFATTTDVASITSVSLPSTLKTIGYNAFYSNAKLAQVTLPAGLETIESYAFGQCDALTTLTIPDSVTTIEDRAFVGCDKLASITIGKGLKTLKPYIGSDAHVFNNIDGLKTITVSSENPNFTAENNVLYTKDKRTLIAYPMNRAGSDFTVDYNVSSVVTCAFNNPANLKKITFQNSAPSLSDECFSYFDGEVHYNSGYSGWTGSGGKAGKPYGGTILWVDDYNGQNKPVYYSGACGYYAYFQVNLSDNTLTISGTGAIFDYNNVNGLSSAPYAAYGSQITSIKVEDGITVIGKNAFRGFTALKSVSLGSTVTEIDNRAFDGCSGLKSIVLPASLMYIREGVFERTGLTSVNLPSNLSYIGASAFKELPITKVTIPSKVTFIGDQAFTQTEGNQTLKTIEFLGAPPTIGGYAFAGVVAEATCQESLGWTASHRMNYGGTLSWKLVGECGSDHSYTYVNLLNGNHRKSCSKCDIAPVTEAHSYVSGVCACGQLSAGQCGDNAYWSYDASTKTLSITGTGSMYDYYFDEDDYIWVTGKTPGWYGLELSKVSIGNGITVVGAYSFYRMDLGDVTLADTVTELRDEAFGGSTANITNSRNLTTVGFGALVNNTIDKVYKPVTVEGESFMYATFLDGNVVVSGDVASRAFFSSNITTLTLCENVKYVRDYSLAGCTSLNAIYFCCDKPDFGNDVYNGGGVMNTPKYYRSSQATGFAESTAIWSDEAHANVLVEQIDATCTEKGYTVYGCSYCSLTVKRNFVDASLHSHTYTADDVADTITVGCKNCDFEGVFELKAPAELDYTGSPIEATVTGAVEGFAVPAITYTGSLTDGKPVSKGTYTAKIQVNDTSVSVEFTIVAMEASVTLGSTTTSYDNIHDAMAVANANSGSVVKLLSDIQLTSTVDVTGTGVTLDLNGFALKKQDDDAILVASGAKLTVKDSVGTGTIYGECDLGYGTGGAIVNKGTLIIDGGTLSAGGQGIRASVINSGSFTLNGGELRGDTSFYQSTGSSRFNGGKLTNKVALHGGSVEITGGDLTAMYYTTSYARGVAITVYGGKIGSIQLDSACTVTVYDGIFQSQFLAGSANVTLYGGTYNRGVSASSFINNILADGHKYFDVATNTVANGGVHSTTEKLEVRNEANSAVVVHIVNSLLTYMYSLDAGIARAEAMGGSLWVLQDITGLTSPIILDAGNYVLNLDGHTISGNVSDGGLIQIRDASVSITSETTTGSVIAGGLIENTGSGYALYYEGTNTAVRKITVRAAGDAICVKDAYLSLRDNVSVVSTGGYAAVLADEDAGLFTFACSMSGNTGVVRVNDGTVYLYNQITASASNGPVFDNVDNGYIALQSTISSGSYSVKVTDTTGTRKFGMISYSVEYTPGLFTPYDPNYYVEHVEQGSFGYLYMKPLATPNGSIDYVNERVVGLVPGAVYTIGSFTYTADENGSIEIPDELMGREVDLVKVGQTNPYIPDSQPQKLVLPQRPEIPTGITSCDESVQGANDGAIFGLNTGLEYCYEDDQGNTTGWQKVTASTMEGLKPGTYYFRYPATGSGFASKSVGIVIGEGLKQLTADDFAVAIPTNRPYDGKPHTATVTLPDGLEAEYVNIYYTFGSGNGQTDEPVDAGTYRLTIQILEGGGFVPGVITGDWEFQILKCHVTAVLAAVGDQTYTGEELKPVPGVTFNGVPDGCRLNGDDHYYFSYENNVIPGEATVTIHCVEDTNYSFGSVSTTFKILPCPVDAKLSIFVDKVIYKGKEYCPTPSVGFFRDSKIVNLESGVDYIVTHSNNLNVGTATVTLSPVAGSYYTFEEKVAEYQIVPNTIGLKLKPIDDQIFTGAPIEPVPQVSYTYTGALYDDKPQLGRDYTLSYENNINVGIATVIASPVAGSNFDIAETRITFNILPCPVMVTIAPIDPQTYTGKAIEPEVNLTFTYQGRPVTLVKDQDYTLTITDNVNAGEAVITVTPVEGGNYTFPVTRGGFRIDPVTVVASVGTLGKFLYTGAAVCPEAAVTFSGVPEGLALTAGTDYVVDYRDNVAVSDSAVLEVRPVEGGNFTFETVTSFFSIQYGVALSDVPEALYVDGASAQLEDGILWLKDEKARMVTWYDYANGDSDDMHKIYPTGMHVISLSFTSEGGYTARRETSLDNLLQYAGTSIRITGNQGIRFITSIPAAKRSSLMGNGLSGYKLVEYGTLMGWYTPGNDLIYGVNAKSVAYDAVKGTNAVFNTTGDVVQFTGMLTNLELEQSTKDLVTRPYMVLERTDASGQKEQVVLYGGSIVRSIGYVAYQNKDVFQPGTASYEFIWNILKYSDPELYEKEHKG